MQENSEKCGWLTHNHWGLNNHWKIGVATVVSYVFFRICVSSIHSILFSWEGCFKWLQPYWWLENHHHPVLSWADILSTLDWLNWECSGKLGHQPFWWFQVSTCGYFRPTVDARWLLFSRWNPSEELKISWILWEVHVFPCGPHEKTSPAMENPEMTCFPKGGLGNAIAVSHIQLPGWFKAKRPDGKHGDRPKYGCLISQRFRRHVVMKTFPWGCSTRNWGYNQYKIGDIHLNFAVSYLCFDGDRESGSKLISSLILLNMIGNFPNRKSTACGIYRNMCFLYLLGFLTQIQVVVSRVCHAPGLVMPNDCYFSTGVKAPIRWLNHALGEK